MPCARIFPPDGDTEVIDRSLVTPERAVSVAHALRVLLPSPYLNARDFFHASRARRAPAYLAPSNFPRMIVDPARRKDVSTVIHSPSRLWPSGCGVISRTTRIVLTRSSSAITAGIASLGTDAAFADSAASSSSVERRSNRSHPVARATR